MALTPGPMVTSMKGSGKKTKSAVKELKPGKMASFTWESGKTTICTEKEFSNGQMAGFTMENSLKTKKKARQFIPTPTAGNMKVSGETISKMEREHITLMKVPFQERVDGNKARMFSGTISDCLAASLLMMEES